MSTISKEEFLQILCKNPWRMGRDGEIFKFTNKESTEKTLEYRKPDEGVSEWSVYEGTKWDNSMKAASKQSILYAIYLYENESWHIVTHHERFQYQGITHEGNLKLYMNIGNVWANIEFEAIDLS